MTPTQQIEAWKTEQAQLAKMDERLESISAKIERLNAAKAYAESCRRKLVAIRNKR